MIDNIPNFDMNLEPEELKKLVEEAGAAIKAGRSIEVLINEYRSKYTMAETFMILTQARLLEVLRPELHNYTGKMNK